MAYLADPHTHANLGTLDAVPDHSSAAAGQVVKRQADGSLAWADEAGAGEVNTASNVGLAGAGLFKQKTGVDLEFRTIKAGANITVTSTADDEVEIAATTGEGGATTESLTDGDGIQAFSFNGSAAEQVVVDFAGTGAAATVARSDHTHASDDSKADKVSGAAAGNLAGLDSSGNLTDSGSAPTDFQAALGFTPEDSADKGQASGYASLDASAKVPTTQLPDTVLGAMEYKGALDASAGTYPGSPEQGDYYVVSMAGTVSGTAYAIGDWAVYNGSSWDKIDNSDKVSSVAGKTGAVTLAVADITDAGDAASKNVGTASGEVAAGDHTHQNPTESIIVACSDESTELTSGAARTTFRMPYGFTLTGVRASLTTSSTSGAVQVDVNEGGTSVLSTVVSIDQGEKTSTTAATPPVISDSALVDDAEMTVDIDAAGTGAAGLKVALIGRRS